MQKQEFESKAGNNISEDDYKLIELVYTWHPSISEIDGKAQILTFIGPVACRSSVTWQKQLCI